MVHYHYQENDYYAEDIDAYLYFRLQRFVIKLYIGIATAERSVMACPYSE